MKDFIKGFFVELFTLMAWATLLGYVFYCTVMAIKTDSVRDAWNILILIAGYVWGKGAREQKKNEPNTITLPEPPTTTTITTEAKPDESPNT